MTLLQSAFLTDVTPLFPVFFSQKFQVHDQHITTDDDQDHEKQNNESNNEAEDVQQQHSNAGEEKNTPADEQVSTSKQKKKNQQRNWRYSQTSKKEKWSWICQPTKRWKSTTFF